MRGGSHYISTLTEAACSGEIELYIYSINATPNTELTCTITGIEEGDSPIDIAIEIRDQLFTFLGANNASFDGVPLFSDEDPVATYNITRTEHVCNLWSEARFGMNIVSNTTGCILTLSDIPAIITIDELEFYCSVNGISLTDANGQAYSDSQLANVIISNSSRLLSILRNNIVISSYVDDFRGKDTKSIFLKRPPIVSWESPRIRRKIWYQYYYIPQYAKQVYIVNFDTGEMSYRPSNVTVNLYEPFALDNEIKAFYTAGYNKIPDEIKIALVDFVGLYSSGGSGATGNVVELKGGSFSVKFGDRAKYIKSILIPVAKYYL